MLALFSSIGDIPLWLGYHIVFWWLIVNEQSIIISLDIDVELPALPHWND